MTYRRNWGVAGGVARLATPAQNGAGSGDQRTYCRLAIHPLSNPAESATLRLHSTSIRNVGTPLGLSARSIAE
jgi:hypothetical protein